MMKKEPEKMKEEPSSMFQRQRVDMLLGELMRKFPLPMIPNPAVPPAIMTDQQASQTRTDTNVGRTDTNTGAAVTTQSIVNGNNNHSVNGDFKPPEKRAK